MAAVQAHAIPYPIEISANAIKERFVHDIAENYLNADRQPALNQQKRDQLIAFQAEINANREADTITLMARIHAIYNHIWNTMQINARGYLTPAENAEIRALGNYSRGGIKIIRADNARSIIKIVSYANEARYRYPPKGEIMSQDIVRNAGGAINLDATLFNAGKRELAEETGITSIQLPQLNNMPAEREVIGNILMFVYRVDYDTYQDLKDHMNNNRDDIPGRSADVRLIYHKKYMKYKAKYLQLVAQLRK